MRAGGRVRKGIQLNTSVPRAVRHKTIEQLHLIHIRMCYNIHTYITCICKHLMSKLIWESVNT